MLRIVRSYKIVCDLMGEGMKATDQRLFFSSCENKRIVPSDVETKVEE